MQRNENVLEMALKKPYASDICEKLGKLFAQDNSGYEFNTLKELTKADDGSVWLAIDRLRNEYHVLESFPEYPKEKPTAGSKVRVPYKFRIKPEYESALGALY